MKRLKLKRWGNYEITSKGVNFYTESGEVLHIPKRIMKRIEGMV